MHHQNFKERDQSKTVKNDYYLMTESLGNFNPSVNLGDNELKHSPTSKSPKKTVEEDVPKVHTIRASMLGNNVKFLLSSNQHLTSSLGSI
jgi:hypothetical protein